jgi:uncharacterized protein YbjT (DUF2867 family)
MKKYEHTILVTGATGRQGGAVARHLLMDGWTVRFLTRDPGKPAAQELERLGATAVRGDLDDSLSVGRAIEGCYGAFSVQDFYQAGEEGEVRQGKGLADAAKAAGVGHFVYTSVGAADRRTGIPHFETKWRIEEHIRSLGIPHTILRPVFFMDNFQYPGLRQGILNGRLSLAVRRGKSLQMIAVSDIGAMAAVVFGNPDRFLWRSVDLAGDELTLPAACHILGSAIGREVRHEEAKIEDLDRSSPELGKMYRWFNEVGYQVDIPSVRAILPALTSFQTWVSEVFAPEFAPVAP